MKKKKRITRTEPYTLSLVKPLPVGTRTVTELNFRVPKAKDLRVLRGKNKVDESIRLAANLCGEAMSIIEELEPTDFIAVQEVVDSFFPDGQVTGSNG